MGKILVLAILAFAVGCSNSSVGGNRGGPEGSVNQENVKSQKITCNDTQVYFYKYKDGKELRQEDQTVSITNRRLTLVDDLNEKAETSGDVQTTTYDIKGNTKALAYVSAYTFAGHRTSQKTILEKGDVKEVLNYTQTMNGKDGYQFTDANGALVSSLSLQHVIETVLRTEGDSAFNVAAKVDGVALDVSDYVTTKSLRGNLLTETTVLQQAAIFQMNDAQVTIEKDNSVCTTETLN